MKLHIVGPRLSLIFAVITFTVAVIAQSAAPAASAATSSANTVPQVVSYSGTLTDINGKPLTGVAGVTFSLYQDIHSASPLWLETQSVTADKTGHYTVMLGSTTAQGLPQDVFVTGEARWLGVKIENQEEQPRVLLVAVPYALKAGDAQTIGGLPASAFVLANSAQASTSQKSNTSASTAATKNNTAAPPANPAVTGKGTLDFIPMWDTTSDIINSVMFQKSSQIGIGTISPAATLDVNGKSDVRDTLTLFPKSTDNTLAVSGTTFKIDQTGKVTFITGQTFPGTGTITGITTASGSGLSGGGTTGTLSLKVPSLGITNAMLQNSKVTLNANTAGGLTTPGAMTLGSTYTIGLKPCSANQVLQYSGSVWNCAAAGTGTVTSVGLAAPSTDFTVSGSPVKTSGTLSLGWTVAPTSADTNNAIVKRDGSGNFAGSTITAKDLETSTLNLIPVFDFAYSAFENTFVADQFFTGNSAYVYVGDPGCGGGYAGIGFNGLGGCNNYSMLGNGIDTFINAPPGGVTHFRNGNTELMTEYSNGELDVNGLFVGFSDVDGNRGFFGSSTASGTQVLFADNDGSDQALQVRNWSGGITGFTEAQFDVNGKATFYTDALGNTTATGSKSAAVPLANGSMVKVFSTESPEVWFEDYGFGHLSAGAATVTIDPSFAQTVSLNGYHVFVTPKGDCKGLYVTNETNGTFEVRELGGGQSGVEFDFRIVAHRKGYETMRLPAAVMPKPGAMKAKVQVQGAAQHQTTSGPTPHPLARPSKGPGAKPTRTSAVVNQKK